MVKHRTLGFEPKIGMTQQEIDAFDVFAVFKKKRHGMRYQASEYPNRLFIRKA